MRQSLFGAEECCFDLAREHVHATHDDHVIAAAANAADAADGATALALRIFDSGDVTSAVAQNRHGALAERADDEFAFLSVRERFKRFRVNNFGVEVVFENVDAVAAFAFATDTRSDNFRKAVNVVCLDARLFFDVVAHAVAPRFCTEDTALDLELRNIDAHLFGHVDNADKVARSATDGGHAKVLHEHHLTFGVAAANRHDCGAERFETAVDAKAACKETVAVEVLHDVCAAESAGEEAALHDLGPDFHVFLGITDDNRLTGSAGACMQTHDFAHIDCKETVRISVAQVLLHGERNLHDVLQGFDVVGGHAFFDHAFVEQRNLFVGEFHGCTQTLQLQFA